MYPPSLRSRTLSSLTLASLVLLTGTFAAPPATAQPAQPARPTRALPSLVLTLPTELTAPVAVSGKLQAKRPNRAYSASQQAAGQVSIHGEGQWGRADAPDLLLRLPKRFASLRLVLLGTQGELLFGDAAQYTATGQRSGGPSTVGSLPAGDVAVWLLVPDAAATAWTVIAWEDKAAPLPDLRFGEPQAAAPLEARALSLYLPWFTTKEAKCGAPSAASAELAHRLFTTLPRSFFVFATQPLSGSNFGGPAPAPGEPLLLAGFTGTTAEVRTSDGSCYSGDSAHLSVTAPATVALPAQRELKLVLAKQQNNKWEREDFLAVAEAKAAADYLTRKQRGWECYSAEWDRLDPDHRAGRFDVVTMQGDRVTKVEELTSKFDRLAEKKCKTQALWKERDALEARTLATFATSRTTWRAAVEARLKELGLAR